MQYCVKFLTGLQRCICEAKDVRERLQEQGELLQGRRRNGESNLALGSNFAGNTLANDPLYAAPCPGDSKITHRTNLFQKRTAADLQPFLKKPWTSSNLFLLPTWAIDHVLHSLVRFCSFCEIWHASELHVAKDLAGESFGSTASRFLTMGIEVLGKTGKKLQRLWLQWMQASVLITCHSLPQSLLLRQGINLYEILLTSAETLQGESVEERKIDAQNMPAACTRLSLCQ